MPLMHAEALREVQRHAPLYCSLDGVLPLNSSNTSFCARTRSRAASLLAAIRVQNTKTQKPEATMQVGRRCRKSSRFLLSVLTRVNGGGGGSGGGIITVNQIQTNSKRRTWGVVLQGLS